MANNPMVVTLDSWVVKGIPDPADSPQWKLQKLDQWFSPPAARTVLNPIPLQDGLFNPGRTFRDGKHMTLIGTVSAVTADMAEQLAWERIAGLSPQGYSMLLEVDTLRGSRFQTVWLDNAQPKVEPISPTVAQFQVPIVAPDPRKYGPQQTGITAPSGGAGDGMQWPMFGSGYLDFGAFSPTGVISLVNTGTAESWPTFRVRGTFATGFTITSGTSTLTYAAAVPLGTEVFLSPYIGGRANIGTADVSNNLTVAGGWPSVVGGASRNLVLSPISTNDGNAQMTWTFAEAWW